MINAVNALKQSYYIMKNLEKIRKEHKKLSL